MTERPAVGAVYQAANFEGLWGRQNLWGKLTKPTKPTLRDFGVGKTHGKTNKTYKTNFEGLWGGLPQIPQGVSKMVLLVLLVFP